MTTNDVVVATSAADSAAVDDVRSRYAELLGRQAALGAAVFAAVGTAGPAFDDAHRAVQAFIDQGVRPQLRAAVELIYPASSGVERSRLLVEGLLGETQLIEQAAARIARDTERVQIAAHVEALRVLLEALLGKVADLLLPALAEASGVSLADLAAQLPAIPSELPPAQPAPAPPTATATATADAAAARRTRRCPSSTCARFRTRSGTRPCSVPSTPFRSGAR